VFGGLRLPTIITKQGIYTTPRKDMDMSRIAVSAVEGATMRSRFPALREVGVLLSETVPVVCPAGTDTVPMAVPPL
jgi:hypothetical protein